MVAPAANERVGVRAARVGGVPPLKCACRLAPLVSEAVTTELPGVGAIMFMVAMPSPVAVVEHADVPQERVALPLTTEKVTVTLPAGTRLGPSAVTVKGIG